MTQPTPASVPVSDGSESARIVGLDAAAQTRIRYAIWNQDNHRRWMNGDFASLERGL